MLIILIIFIVGIFLGWLLKSQQRLIKSSHILTLLSVLALLFFLGYEAGSNREVVANFHDIGLKAAVISVFSVIGSVIAVSVFGKILLKPGDKS